MKMIEYLYIGMLCVATLLLFFAFKHYNATKTLQLDGVRTKATVVDLIEIRGDDSYTYKPVFEYTNRNNAVVRFNSSVSSSPPAYKVGESVMIIYEKHGDERKIVSFWGLYRWTIILMCIAAPLLIIGGGYMLYSKG
ncbi:hypothetical protein BKP44_18460 [Formosa algae]|nr:hypothetical protein BKP44_18460 [Formosa algae]